MQIKKSDKYKIKIYLFFFVTFVVSCLFISLAPILNMPSSIPAWSDIFNLTDLRNNSNANNQPLSVHFIDVGQGDCIFVNTAHGNILIDAGGPGNSDTIIRYLRNLNVDKLDYVVISHPDLDHIGSMPEVIDALDVKNIIMPYIEKQNLPTTIIFKKLLISISKMNINVLPANPGICFTFGNIITNIIGPVSTNDEMNNMSVVIKIEFGNNSFLLTGDAETEEENEILANENVLKADVLKAGHHGSENSSGTEFLASVLPEYVIISCGKDNLFGHPNAETLNRFKRIDAKVLRTDQCGTIVIGSDGEKLTVYCESDGD